MSIDDINALGIANAEGHSMTADHSILRLANERQAIVPEELMLLQRVKAFNHAAAHAVEEFLAIAKLSALAREYSANMRKRDVDIGFNLFAIISDLYYRENFHSDVLKALIDPNGKHQEQEKYLHLFLKFIGSHGTKINFSDYSKVQVEREEGRVDILIKDDGSKKAIIIENKINDAADMERQIPRYLEWVRNNGYTCEGIVYLRLNGDAGPDTRGWTAHEKKQVGALLKVVSAYDGTEKDLLHGWILKCQRVSNNPDAQHILRQYGDLIKKLGGKVMNMPIMEKFYLVMTEGENFKTAQSLKSMLDDLVDYRRDRIINTFRMDAAPFEKVWSYRNAAVFDTKHRGTSLALDVAVEPESYSFQFFDRNNGGGNDQAKATLQKMGCLSQYTCQDGRFTKPFAFPSQEADLYRHILDFKMKLAKVISND